MSHSKLEAHLAENPKMAGVLFAIMLLRFRTGAAATRSTTYAGP